MKKSTQVFTILAGAAVLGAATYILLKDWAKPQYLVYKLTPDSVTPIDNSTKEFVERRRKRVAEKRNELTAQKAVSQN